MPLRLRQNWPLVNLDKYLNKTNTEQPTNIKTNPSTYKSPPISRGSVDRLKVAHRRAALFSLRTHTAGRGSVRGPTPLQNSSLYFLYVKK